MKYFEGSFIEQGGILMYPLLAVSLLGFVLFIERALYLHKGQIGVEDFLNGIKNLVRKKRLLEALTLCEDTPGPMPRIVKSALLQYGESHDSVRLAIQSRVIVEIPRLERRVGTIAALARVATLLGFLGTLVGALQILDSFRSFNGDSFKMAELLGRTLMNSACGIGIAIMAMMAYYFLSARVRALVHDFERLGHNMYEFLTLELAQDETLGAKETGR